VKRERATCWAVFREVEHSPGRETDDAAILRAVGARLEEADSGWKVEYRSPAAITGREGVLPVMAFSMCEGSTALGSLGRWEGRGVRVVNSARSVVNTHRECALPLLDAARVPVPESRVLDSADPSIPEDPALYSSCWVKQATEHKTREGDVVFATDARAVAEALQMLRARKLPRVVVQRHLDGDLVKFYGVGSGAGIGTSSEGGESAGPSWFRWFHPREHPPKGHAFDAGALRDIARRAAGALGLEVWGGDAIVTREGAIFVIDVNAWPSFALYRDEAADHIAAHLAARLKRVARVAV